MSLLPIPNCTGCVDRDGNLIYLGDKVRHFTYKGYADYEIVWDPPTYAMKRPGFVNVYDLLRNGGTLGNIEIIDHVEWEGRICNKPKDENLLLSVIEELQTSLTETRKKLEKLTQGQR